MVLARDSEKNMAYQIQQLQEQLSIERERSEQYRTKVQKMVTWRQILPFQ